MAITLWGYTIVKNSELAKLAAKLRASNDRVAAVIAQHPQR